VLGHLINFSSSKFQINSTMHSLKIFNELPSRIFQDNALWLHILSKRFVHHITVTHGSWPSNLQSLRGIGPSRTAGDAKDGDHHSIAVFGNSKRFSALCIKNRNKIRYHSNVSRSGIAVFDALVSCKLMGRRPLYIGTGRGVTDPLTGPDFP
jgi:hypothetical protein